MSKPTHSQRNRFVPEPVPIWLGSGDKVQEYKVVPAPWGALFKLKDVLRDLLEETTTLWNTQIVSTVKAVAAESNDETGLKQLQALLVNEKVWELLDHLLAKPHEFFRLAIPDLDPSLFDAGNSEGATIPQVWATFEVIAQVNRLDIAKNLFGGRPGTPPQTSTSTDSSPDSS